MISYISNLMIPLIIFLIIFYANIKKIDVYGSFLEGAKESIEMTLSIFPSLIAMVLGVNIFIKSGLLKFIFSFFKIFKVPAILLTLSIMRPISGSSSLALLNEIYSLFGPDSKIGIVASIIQGSTETTFYVLSLYFGSIGIKKIRHALICGLLADLFGIISAFVIANLLF